MQQFSMYYAYLAFGAVEYNDFSFDLARGQIEMGKFKHHKISLK